MLQAGIVDPAKVVRAALQGWNGGMTHDSSTVAARQMAARQFVGESVVVRDDAAEFLDAVEHAREEQLWTRPVESP